MKDFIEGKALNMKVFGEFYFLARFLFSCPILGRSKYNVE